VGETLKPVRHGREVSKLHPGNDGFPVDAFCLVCLAKVAQQRRLVASSAII